MNHHWVVLVYKIPSEPTKYRATVWREIKRLGGVYLQNSVCIFPDIDDVSLDVSALAGRIRTMEGSEYMFFTQSPTQEQADELIQQFQLARTEEYDESFKSIHDIEERIKRTSTEEEFQSIFDDVKKLRRQIGVIKGRDYFNAPRGREVTQSFQQLQERLKDLAKGEHKL